MSFLDDAQRSYRQVTCKTIRRILYECAAESLRRLVISRRKDSNSSAESSSSSLSGDDENDSPNEHEHEHSAIAITEADVDAAYSITHKIGTRWVQKLVATHEDHDAETSRLVERMLERGHFLDASRLDDVTDLDPDVPQMVLPAASSPSNHALYRNKDNADADADADSDSSEEELPTATSPMPNNDDESVSVSMSVSHATTPYDRKSLATIQQSMPYSTLLNIGQVDPCHLHSTTGTMQHGNASQWHPLPALQPSSSTTQSSSFSCVHIPNAINLSPVHIQRQSQDQLYGLPSLRMPKPMIPKTEIDIIDEMGTTLPVHNRHFDPDADQDQDQDQDHDDPPHSTGVHRRKRLHPTHESNTMWPYDWNIVQEQANRNHDRLHPQKKGPSRHMDDDGYEEMVQIIPKSLLDDRVLADPTIGRIGGTTDATTSDVGNGGSGSNGGQEGGTAAAAAAAAVAVLQQRMTSTHQQEEDDGPMFVGVSEEGGTQRLSAVKAFQKKIMASKLKKKWNHDHDHDHEDDHDHGRLSTAKTMTGRNRNHSRMVVSKKPSIYGDRQWSCEQIKNELGEDVMSELEQTMIHPLESTGSGAGGDNSSSCQGALKHIGSIHLWEQMRSNQWKGKVEEIPQVDEGTQGDGEEEKDDDDDDGGVVDPKTLKLRKAIHRKAKRHRLYPNYEAGTKGYHDSKLTSKIIWAETETEKDSALDLELGVGDHGQSMELDLTDCIVSLITTDADDDHDHDHHHHHLDSSSGGRPLRKKMKTLAFRSLEISLND